MKRKIIYCDLDGCIVDFDKAMEEHNPDIVNYTSYEDRCKLVDEICYRNPKIFETLEPIAGGIDAVKRLFDIAEVYFLSTAMWWVPDSYTGKRIWIEKYFGELAQKRLILTHRKDLNIGDFLIDDRTANGAGEFTGEHIHFGTEKFPNWDVTFKYIFDKITSSN